MRIVKFLFWFALGIGGTTVAAVYAADTAARVPAPAAETWDGEESPLPLPLPPGPDGSPPPGLPPMPPAGLSGAPPVVPPGTALSSPVSPTPITPLPPPASSGQTAPPAAPPPFQPPVLSAPAPAASAPIPAGTRFMPVVTQLPIEEQPRRARIRADGGGRIHLRAGPGTNFEIITTVLSGAPVTVYAMKDEWYKIAYPAESLVSIPAAYVTSALPDEMPESGVPGRINAEGAKLYVRHSERSTIVGEARRGEEVVVKRVRNHWLQILPPPTARAYVHSQLVELIDAPTAPLPADQAPAANPNLETLVTAGGASGGASGTAARSGAGLTPEQAKLRQDYYDRVQNNWERLLRDDDLEAERIREQARTQRRNTPLEDFDAHIASIQSRVYGAADVERYRSPGAAVFADPADGGFTGWIEYVGRYGNRPAAFRLTKGGETRFFLRSAKVRLEDYNYKRVWVNGYSEAVAGAAANVLVVEEIRVLGEPPETLRDRKVDIKFPDLGPVVDPRDQVNPVIAGDSAFPAAAPASGRELPPIISSGDVVPMGRTQPGPAFPVSEQAFFPAPSREAETPVDSNRVFFGSPETFNAPASPALDYGIGVSPAPAEPIMSLPPFAPEAPAASEIPSMAIMTVEEYSSPPSPTTPLPGSGNVPAELPAFVGP